MSFRRFKGQSKMLLNSVLLVLIFKYVDCEIGGRGSALVNKLIKINAVGPLLAKNFVPLTEIPPPRVPSLSGRRHLEDCSQKPDALEVFDSGRVNIIGEYYDDRVEKTVATVIIPDHIDRKFFEVTTQVPYFTVGPIEALGHHPSTPKNEHLPECEKIYQDHLAEQYSEESTDYSEESLEMARMPLYPKPVSEEIRMEDIY